MSMSDDTEKTVHIYLGKPEEKERVFANASSHEKYIILMNESLQSENRRLTIKITEQTQRVEELEGDEDRAEVRMNNVKGLLKNFNEMHKWDKEVSQKTAAMLSKTRDNVNGFKQKAVRHFYYLQGVLLCFLCLHIEMFSATESLSVGTILAIVVAFQISTLRNLVLPTFPTEEKRIKELLKELKTTLAAQDYIHEFIDQQ